MSDEHVLAWLEERPLEELTAIELATIRRRAAESTAVREALAGRLRLEQALHQTVGQVRLPVELLLAKAVAIQATSTVAKLLGWGSVTGLMIGVVSVGLVIPRIQHAPRHQLHVAAEQTDEPASPSDLPPEADGQSRMLASSPAEDAAPQHAGSAPAMRDWRPQLPLGATWNVLPAGRVELLAEDTLEESRAACHTNLGIGEIVCELEDPVPGTGLYFTDARGEASYRLAFIHDEADQVCFALTSQEPSLARLQDGPEAVCPPRVWFKLTAADGTLRGSFSCDGASWSPVIGTELPFVAPLSAMGLYCAAGPGSRWVRVANFSITPAAEKLQAARNLFGGATQSARRPQFLTSQSGSIRESP